MANAECGAFNLQPINSAIFIQLLLEISIYNIIKLLQCRIEIDRFEKEQHGHEKPYLSGTVSTDDTCKSIAPGTTQ
uniref:Uncharacterized protein n=1 Tax=Vespula pensylvanica TaxID=30213 RepID=A0A834N332_VESPE|nr:hypothetical protein H0235_017447 [Vespula pensylvanica]